MFEREKTLEALTFFQGAVRSAGHLKLLKLLFYLDLLHLRQTGRTVTGLTYEAWPMGPVPRSLWQEIKDDASPLRQHFEVRQPEAIEEPATEAGNERGMRVRHVPGQLIARRPFAHRYLTRRELQLARDLAEMFRDALADQMSEVSHNQNGPWRLALQHGGNTAPIDLLAGDVGLGRPEDRPPPHELAERMAERAEALALLR